MVILIEEVPGAHFESKNHSMWEFAFISPDIQPFERWTLREIVEQLDACNYQCEAGGLDHNEAFIALKRMAGL